MSPSPVPRHWLRMPDHVGTASWPFLFSIVGPDPSGGTTSTTPRTRTPLWAASPDLPPLPPRPQPSSPDARLVTPLGHAPPPHAGRTPERTRRLSPRAKKIPRLLAIRHPGRSGAPLARVRSEGEYSATSVGAWRSRCVVRVYWVRQLWPRSLRWQEPAGRPPLLHRGAGRFAMPGTCGSAGRDGGPRPGLAPPGSARGRAR
jgi:hypothetical protein